jgi:hypothetical protein
MQGKLTDADGGNPTPGLLLTFLEKADKPDFNTTNANFLCVEIVYV